MKRMTSKRLICGLVTTGALAVSVGCSPSVEDETSSPDEAVSSTTDALYATCSYNVPQGACRIRASCGGGDWYVCEVTGDPNNTTTSLRNSTGTGHHARILWADDSFSDCKWIGAGGTTYFFPNWRQWIGGAKNIQDC
jgi:hypothetical protein